MTEGPSFNSRVSDSGQPVGSSGEIKRIKDEVSALCNRILQEPGNIKDPKQVESIRKLSNEINKLQGNDKRAAAVLDLAVGQVRAALGEIQLKKTGVFASKAKKEELKKLQEEIKAGKKSLEQASEKLTELKGAATDRKADTTPAGPFALFSKLSKREQQTVIAEVRKAVKSNNTAVAEGKKGLTQVEQCKLSYLSGLSKLSNAERAFVNDVLGANNPVGKELAAAVRLLKKTGDDKKQGFPGEVRKEVLMLINEENAMPNSKNLNIMADYITMQLLGAQPSGEANAGTESEA